MNLGSRLKWLFIKTWYNKKISNFFLYLLLIEKKKKKKKK